MILGISCGGMCPQSMLQGHTSAYHSCPGCCAVYASIALLIVALRSSSTSCGRFAILAAVAAAAAAAAGVASVLSMNSLYMSVLEYEAYYIMRM